MPKNQHGPMTVEVYESRAGNAKQRYRWRARSQGNGRKVASSGEGYARIFDATDMATFVIGPPDPDTFVTEAKSAGIVRRSWTVTK